MLYFDSLGHSNLWLTTILSLGHTGHTCAPYMCHSKGTSPQDVHIIVLSTCGELGAYWVDSTSKHGAAFPPNKYGSIIEFPPYLVATNSSHMLPSPCPKEHLSCSSAIFPSLLLLLLPAAAHICSQFSSAVSCSWPPAPLSKLYPLSSSFNFFSFSR